MFDDNFDYVSNGISKKQGRIHGYPSRVRVGRGCYWGYQIIWAGAVRQKIAKTPKKVKCARRTDQPTKWVVESRSTRQKSMCIGNDQNSPKTDVNLPDTMQQSAAKSAKKFVMRLSIFHFQK